MTRPIFIRGRSVNLDMQVCLSTSNRCQSAPNFQRTKQRPNHHLLFKILKPEAGIEPATFTFYRDALALVRMLSIELLGHNVRTPCPAISIEYTGGPPKRGLSEQMGEDGFEPPTFCTDNAYLSTTLWHLLGAFQTELLALCDATFHQSGDFNRLRIYQNSVFDCSGSLQP